jgi:hypothetical protein
VDWQIRQQWPGSPALPYEVRHNGNTSDVHLNLFTEDMAQTTSTALSITDQIRADVLAAIKDSPALSRFNMLKRELIADKKRLTHSQNKLDALEREEFAVKGNAAKGWVQKCMTLKKEMVPLRNEIAELTDRIAIQQEAVEEAKQAMERELREATESVFVAAYERKKTEHKAVEVEVAAAMSPLINRLLASYADVVVSRWGDSSKKLAIDNLWHELVKEA